MPAIGTVANEVKYEIQGLVRDSFGVPYGFARVAFIPILDGPIAGVLNTTMITQSDVNGRWSVKLNTKTAREFIVAINDDKFHIRLPTDEGKYDFDSLIIE